MFSPLVTKSTNFSALRFRSSEMFAGIASPAPPVGHPGVPSGAGRNAVPKSNAAFAVMPDRSPVEAMVDAMIPAEKSLAMSVDTPAYLPVWIMSFRNCPAAIVSASPKRSRQPSE